jgi:hypothetical protein
MYRMADNKVSVLHFTLLSQERRNLPPGRVVEACNYTPQAE